MEFPERTALDRAIGYLAPGWELKRLRSRMIRDVLATQYDAATSGRRTHGWRRSSGGPNTVSGLTLAKLRNTARDLVRNNGHAQSAIQVIQDDVVGWGIRASERTDRWRQWAESTACDADGRCDLTGIQQTVIRTIVSDGECLIRRRRRRLSDGLPIPLQLQVLEPDHLDSNKHQRLPGGRRIIRGVEFDALGNREAYWLYPDHPGSSLSSGLQSVRIPASEVCHVFKPERPGQVRGVTWYAPILLRLKDYDDLADATLMKQRVAAVLAAITYDKDGLVERIGDEDTDEPAWDLLEPGLIYHSTMGSGVEVVNPPSVRDYPEYAKFTRNEIAAGIGVTPEDLSGDYSDMNFSSARMSRLRHFGRVSGWRWRMMVPQFLDTVWTWAMRASILAGDETVPMRTNWTAPGLPMIEPDKEGLAILRNVRTGIQTLSEAIRERGYNPDEFLEELRDDFEQLDELGLVLDSDPRKMTQAGQLHDSLSGVAVQAGSRLSEFLGKLPPDLRDQVIESAGEHGGVIG